MNAIRSVNRYHATITEKPIKGYVVFFTRRKPANQPASAASEIFFKTEIQSHSEHVAWAVATEQFLQKFPQESLDDFTIEVELVGQ